MARPTGSGPAVRPDPRLSQPHVVILAGDIDVGIGAITWADSAFPNIPVIYVSRNHEAYGRKIGAVKEALARECAATGHVHFLDKGKLVLDGLRFLGATLWTDFQLLGSDSYQDVLQAPSSRMNEYRRIRLAKDGYRRIRPLDTAHCHREERIWLESALSQTFAGPTVVVTHTAPSGRSIHERFNGDVLSGAFASDLDHLVRQSDLWVHGHVHDSMDYTLGDARVVCNPLGYPIKSAEGNWRAENLDCDSNFIVEV